MKSMRLKQRAVTDRQGLRAILDECRVLRIAAVDDDGVFIVPMSFGYEWEDDAELPTIWLHGAGRGRKAAAFRAGGDDGTAVAFELDIDDGLIEGPHACDYSMAYRSIMGAGRVFPVESGEDKVYGLDFIMEHTAPGAPSAYGPGIIDRTSVWRLDVTELSGKAHRRS